MDEAMLDARQEGSSYRRIEVITGQRRRRQWTAEEKARIVAESFEEGPISPRSLGVMALFVGC
jgi:transposase